MINQIEIIRGGTHTSIQDDGFNNVKHLGVTTGGVIDIKLFRLANMLVKNNIKTPVIEFAYQGPSLKIKKGKCRIAITGNVVFKIIKDKKNITGRCFKTYNLGVGDILDVKSTVDSNYGYIAIEGGFKLNKIFKSYSTLTSSKIGFNDGKCLQKGQKIFFNKNRSSDKNLFINIKKQNLSNIIRVIQGPQMNYFMIKTIKNFFNKPFTISNTANRIGVRLKNNTIKSVKTHDIPSEGIVKGSIQVPGNGDPIVLINDHPTIGGYPKIAKVIQSDLSKLAQLPIGSIFYFKEITLKEAEKNLIKYYNEIDKLKDHIFYI
tara:strand:- start:81 stop:1034 length:954 start_codon:yes stop_codon:yes gene_type:complete